MGSRDQDRREPFGIVSVFGCGGVPSALEAHCLLTNCVNSSQACFCLRQPLRIVSHQAMAALSHIKPEVVGRAEARAAPPTADPLKPPPGAAGVLV